MSITQILKIVEKTLNVSNQRRVDKHFFEANMGAVGMFAKRTHQNYIGAFCDKIVVLSISLSSSSFLKPPYHV